MRLGIFGGSFSPPHLGHRGAAESFLRELSLDRLLIMPAAIPPHKSAEGIAKGDHRLAMCRLAFAGLPNTEVSDLELCREGKSYTYLTLEELSSPERELFFLVGTDMMLTLDKWRYPDILFSRACIVTAARVGDPASYEAVSQKKEEYEREFDAKITLLQNRVLETSSSEIRELVLEGRSTDGLLLPAVRAYIDQWNLYRTSQKTI